LDNHTIDALSTLPAAGLVLDKAVGITIRGGYDAAYSSSSGLTPVTGPLIIQFAPLAVTGLAIRP